MTEFFLPLLLDILHRLFRFLRLLGGSANKPPQFLYSNYPGETYPGPAYENVGQNLFFNRFDYT